MSLSKYKLNWQKQDRKKYPEKYRLHAIKSLPQRRQHYAIHRDEIKIKRASYFASHRERARQTAKTWKIKNREHVNTINANRRARQLNAQGFHTLGEWELLKKQYGYTCPSCGKSEPNIILTRDHIIPLIKGGSNFIENIQPLCRPCNSSKNDKILTFLNKNKSQTKI